VLDFGFTTNKFSKTWSQNSLIIITFFVFPSINKPSFFETICVEEEDKKTNNQITGRFYPHKPAQSVYDGSLFVTIVQGR
jgi:hypothetical protein